MEAVKMSKTLRKLREELDALPEKGKFDLGGKGNKILSEIHKLEIQLEREEHEDMKILLRFAKNQPLLRNKDLKEINDYMFNNFLMVLDLLESDDMLDLFLEQLTEKQKEQLYAKKAVEWHDLLP